MKQSNSSLLQADDSNSNSSVWYFAYGSNMCASIMSGRGLHIADTYSATVPSYELNFDVFGIPYTDPAMASISPRLEHNACRDPYARAVHGVLYLISKSDWIKLIRSEGAGTAYREIEIDAKVILSDGTQVIRASTLIARYPFRPNASPSSRYLDILVKGAREQGLPSEYVRFLESIPTINSVECKQRPGTNGFIAFWMFFVLPLMRWVKVNADENGRAPEWMGYLVWLLFRLLWWHHDFIHSRIWSNGSGSKINARSAGEDTGPHIKKNFYS